MKLTVGRFAWATSRPAWDPEPNAWNRAEVVLSNADVCHHLDERGGFHGGGETQGRPPWST